MALVLLRHTTPDVVPGTCYGLTDLGLAASFQAEADAALAALPGAQRIISSPLQRCRKLAEAAGAHFGLDVQVSSHWVEMDFGRWEGQAWDHIPRPELDAWAEDFHGYDGHGGESVARLAERVKNALAQTPDDTLVVTHSGCIRAAAALHDIGKGWNIEVPFGGTLRL